MANVRNGPPFLSVGRLGGGTAVVRGTAGVLRFSPSLLLRRIFLLSAQTTESAVTAKTNGDVTWNSGDRLIPLIDFQFQAPDSIGFRNRTHWWYFPKIIEFLQMNSGTSSGTAAWQTVE